MIATSCSVAERLKWRYRHEQRQNRMPRRSYPLRCQFNRRRPRPTRASSRIARITAVVPTTCQPRSGSPTQSAKGRRP